MTGAAANRSELSGRLLERSALRYTPAGIPVVEFRVEHASEQMEADMARRVDCEMACIALGNTALLLKEAKPGDCVSLTGFLAARSVKNRNVVLHVNRIEFLEGNQHGIQTQG